MALLQRSEASVETAQKISIGLSSVKDGDGQPMSVSASAGKFGFAVGGWGTGGAKISGESANANTKTDDAFFDIVLPQNYEAGTDLILNIRGRVDVVRNPSATVDVEAYRSDTTGGVGSDLNGTAAQSVNSTTWATVSFTIDGTTLSPGDRVEFYLRGAADDSAGSTVGNIEIGAIDYTTSTRM